jgi:hypothetical protein
MTVEPLTPLSVEQKPRQLVNDLARAQVVLREARDQGVDARHEYDRARRKALLSEKSPKVTKGGYTVAEHAAWVEEECAGLKFAADKAIVVREAHRTGCASCSPRRRSCAAWAPQYEPPMRWPACPANPKEIRNAGYPHVPYETSPRSGKLGSRMAADRPPWS